MNKMVTKFLSILLVFLLSLLIFGCTGEITDPTTSSDLTTTTSQTTSNTTTTTTSQTTQSVTTTSQTQDPLGDIIYENIDELVLSINRLENANFTIDTDFQEDTSLEQVNYLHPDLGRRNLLFSRCSLNLINADFSLINPDDYIQDETYDYLYYHKSLFDSPALIGGMYQLTSFLDGYTYFNRQEFINDLSGIANRSQDSVYWAIDNIKIMNTWIEYEIAPNVTNKYLLDYDPLNDVVSLYVHGKIVDTDSEDYQKINVFYNDLGEEVIETYTYINLTTPSDLGVKKSLTYYNSVNHRDYNLAFADFDENGNVISDNLCLRGVNLGEDGKYRFYENYSWDIRNYTKGDFGWYMYGNVGIDYDLNEVTLEELDTYYSVFSQDLNNAVLDMMKYSDSYFVSINLSAFEGYNALLFEEGSLYQQSIVPISSPVNYFNTSGYTSGIETSLGSYYSTDARWNDTVQLYKVGAVIGKESRSTWNQYYNYFGTLQLKIYTNSTTEALSALEGYLNQIGLSYRFGSLHDFLTEMNTFHASSSENLETFSFLNDSMGYVSYPYTDADAYQSALEFLFDYMDISEQIDDLISSCDIIPSSEQPEILDLSTIVLVNLDGIFNDAIQFDSNDLTLDARNLTITVPRSPLFQRDLAYSLVYSYQVGGVLYPFYTSASQTYDGNEMTFDTSTTIDLTFISELKEGINYQVVVYIGRVQEDTIWRISNIVALQVETFDTFEHVEEIGGSDFTFEISYFEESIWIVMK